jgi:hypothetical protein
LPSQSDRYLPAYDTIKGETSMRQKYSISQEGAANDLTIKEYAIVDKELHHSSWMLVEDSYALMYQENYAGKVIESAISKGLDVLITTLRTDNLFPIEPFASKIAETVVALYDSNEDRTVEVFFDDIDAYAVS